MIWTMGEMIVEIMREKEDTTLYDADRFVGPFPSGAPAIFIDTAAKMGKKCGIIGCVGNDDFGRCLTDRLTRDGADCRFVSVSPSISTGCAFVTYFRDGSRKFIFHIGNSAAGQAKMPAEREIPESSFFHIMGCSLMSDPVFGAEIIKTMKAFQAKGAKVSFDPNIRPELLGDAGLVTEVMQEVSVFMPGVSELLMISGTDTVEKAVEKCFANPKLEIIALKNGSKGCRIFTRDGYYEMGIYPVEAKDATGAGDSFDAAFLCGLCDGKSIADCANQASAAAALNTAAFGPMEGVITPEIVNNMILQYS